MTDRETPSVQTQYGQAWKEVVWDLIHRAHAERRRVLVCADRATVTWDQRGGEGPRAAGDFVGHVISIDKEGFTLGSWSFTTRIEWAATGMAWYRDEAPDPCPRCGGTG